jgi:quercetin dioxygenase-like cupin family protein
MTGLDCLRAGLLLDRRTAGLSEAERLLLEQHLGSCRSCAKDAGVLSAAADLLTTPVELSEVTRSRLLARAIESPAPAPVAAPPRAAARRLAWAVAAAAAVLLVLGSSLLPRPATTVHTPLARGADHARRAALDPELSGDQPVIVAERTVRRAAHARVELAPGSAVSWHEQETLLFLAAGRVRVSVDPAQKQPFVVQTPSFRVEVLGTIFDVTVDGVHVLRGKVRVHAAGSEAVLSAGKSWTSPEPEPARTRSTASPAAPLLVRARRLLASGDAPLARREVERALALRPSPAEAAEARSLLAECALVSGDTADAQRRYADVARRHPGTAAAETATFAAARLEKNPARARRLLEEYLARHPKGRFRSEAKRRLRELEGR